MMTPFAYKMYTNKFFKTDLTSCSAIPELSSIIRSRYLVSLFPCHIIPSEYLIFPDSVSQGVYLQQCSHSTSKE
jgi:hypothetical protein